MTSLPWSKAVTHYVAARIIERERALAEDENPLHARLHRGVHGDRAVAAGAWCAPSCSACSPVCVALFRVLWVVASRLPH